MNDGSSSRIVSALRDWIADAAPGSQLPSTRALVSHHGASPVTVQKAIRELTALGLVESRPGVGTFVRAVRTARPADYGWQSAALGTPRHPGAVASAMRSASHDTIPLHSGYPDRELLPERLVRAALTRAARSDAALTRPPVAGLPELQSWFARELGSAAPAGVNPPHPSDVVVVPGSQSALGSIFGALAGTDRPVLMESPTYWGAILAARRAGLDVVPVPSGPAGPESDQLARAFAETGARVFYAQPTYANPTGAQWTPDRADEVLQVVRDAGAFLIEDDWAHEFGITTTARPLAAYDDAGHVVHLRSLTKSVSPAIRVAAVIARGPARERLLGDQVSTSMYVSGLLQAAALDVVSQPAWRTHLRGLRTQLRDCRDLLHRCLAEHAPRLHVEHLPPGGLNLWARLPDGTDLDAVVQRCERGGVLVAGGHEWFPAEPAGSYLRLNYSGPDPASFADAARVIGAAVDEAG
ncbi:aminotransferase-like domain-containing protein [Luteipulveratus halotolerans]|uniref:GntR family transcriptional regulator n=1 Tax=Luteipulveratus halotolerans TaxID=1631356 RepID=A0A0L6CLZ9_9MICO|nr:PLP-dependent aminotransferase family protein [Luteipulveratus halotolerans]KNX38660.1 GntR family transcriptional regulator [Luteipulveratus halotolerans]